MNRRVAGLENLNSRRTFQKVAHAIQIFLAMDQDVIPAQRRVGAGVGLQRRRRRGFLVALAGHEEIGRHGVEQVVLLDLGDERKLLDAGALLGRQKHLELTGTIGTDLHAQLFQGLAPLGPHGARQLDAIDVFSRSRRGVFGDVLGRIVRRCRPERVQLAGRLKTRPRASNVRARRGELVEHVLQTRIVSLRSQLQLRRRRVARAKESSARLRPEIFRIRFRPSTPCGVSRRRRRSPSPRQLRRTIRLRRDRPLARRWRPRRRLCDRTTGHEP